jgi:elongation factor G
LESIRAADPVISVALEPENSGDLDKLTETLGKLTEEDPTFKAKVDDQTGQTIISGMGELHLEVLTQRIAREFGLNVRAGRPQVVFRETIGQAAAGEGLFDRELGGARHRARAVVAVEPLSRGAGYQAQDRLPDPGTLPPPLLAAALNTLAEGGNAGPLQGFPLLDLKAGLTELELGEGEDSEAVVTTAVSLALREALGRAAPTLMEPMMHLEITTPDEFMGEIIGDLAARKGRVEDLAGQTRFKVVTALAPLSELFGYSTAIRSQTQGRGSFTMHFSHYDVTARK